MAFILEYDFYAACIAPSLVVTQGDNNIGSLIVNRTSAALSSSTKTVSGDEMRP